MFTSKKLSAHDSDSDTASADEEAAKKPILCCHLDASDPSMHPNCHERAYHDGPHKMWGVFPHLAYEVFQAKQDGWKISMKYFQNVVDTVRDLMSPTGKEQSYKAGMKKDADGFMDITWCQSKVLHTWDDLRREFLAANARKAIAPTQFNHRSTRGSRLLHPITFENALHPLLSKYITPAA